MSFGGGGDNKQYNLNLRKAFADTPDSRFEEYVDSRGDLANAWRQIQENPNDPDSQYWIRKAEGGRFNKADFGRFHAAEDQALLAGNYPGGTEVRKGTDAYSSYFPEGTTRFDQFSSEGAGGDGESVGAVALPLSPIQEAAERNIYFPMLVPEYSAPQALDYSAYTSMSPFGGDGGLLYQPGTQQYREAYPIADNILSYQPPEIGFPQVTYARPVSLGIMEEGGEGGGGSNKKKGKKKGDELTELDMRGADPDAMGMMPGEQGYGLFSGQVAAEAAMGLDPFGGIGPSVSNDLGDTYGDPMV